MKTSAPLPGTFIVVEGVDGCGSTTHSRLLAKALRSPTREVVLTCEPTNGPIGSLIRQILQKRLFVTDATGPRGFAWSTLALLFAADRLDHLDSVVMPALRDGSVVVSDRYLLSSLAYQSATSPEGATVVPWIHEVNGRAQRPDLIISDLSMPGLTGLDLIRALRSDARTAGMRILILTADASPDGKTSVLATGADDYLVKPVEPALLARRVKALLA